jgi:hypothetical protein
MRAGKFWRFGFKSFGMMVARDGVEPPTPAFSGLDTAKRICLILLALPFFSTASDARLLEH